LDRRESSDIAGHFKDDLASRQRFVLGVECDDECVLDIRNTNGDAAKRTFGELRDAQSFAVGEGTFHIDQLASVTNMSYDLTRTDVAAERIRVAISRSYKFLFVPILLIGIAAFIVATVEFRRSAFANVCFLMALVCWLLVLSRVGLLLLIAASSLPALAVHYMAPAYFLLVSGAVLSFAALIQLTRELPGKAGGQI
jgi:hypothetical protein